ncbi:MAG: hypothetical protein ABIP94_17140 [Planctomycetota bacterium]
MKVRTDVKGGKITVNHNQTQLPAAGLAVQTAVKGGRLSANHNQTLVRRGG